MMSEGKEMSMFFQVIAEKMKKGVQRYLVVRNECANKNYTTEFVQQLFSEEGKGEVTNENQKRQLGKDVPVLHPYQHPRTRSTGRLSYSVRS